jgi:general secretion pathway protein I
MVAERVHGRRSAQGMTLIEVLVALAIVAITLASGFKAAGGLTINAQRLSDITVAHWCAENQLTYLRLAKPWPSPGNSDFECKQLGRELKGVQRVKPTLNPNFRQVDAQIYDENQRPIVRLSAVLARY